jgi:hypothetical protein
VEIDLTCGRGYLSMKLTVSEFAPKSDELARIPAITTQSTDRVPSFEYQYPPPIAFRSTYAELTEKCRAHIELVVRRQQHTLNLVAWRGNKISKMILEAVSRYHRSIRPPSNVS